MGLPKLVSLLACRGSSAHKWISQLERDTLAYQFPKASEFSEQISYHNGIAHFRDS